MSIKAMNWAWDIRLQPAVKLVLLKLADRANDDGECWPGQESIATACDMSERSVMRHIGFLERVGILSVGRRKGEDGRQETNLYTLNFLYKPGDKLSPGDDGEPGDNQGQNRVTLLSPVLKEEPPVEPSDARARTREAVGNQESILQAPVVLNPDGTWAVDDAVFDRWIDAFKGLRSRTTTEDWIEAELVKASLWLQANPRKRKKNLLRFVTGWLDRASNPPPRPASLSRPHQRLH